MKSISELHIVLASASPRRIGLLHQIGLAAEVMPSHQPEVVTSTDPETVVRQLSRQKAENIASQIGLTSRETVVIGADTVVAVDGRILGKPKTHEEAYDMVHELAGRTHHVYTGVTICYAGGEETFTECTAVHVAPMTEEEIRTYADSEEPMDKAGAYGIQGLFGRYIEGIDGDYNNVVGLPVAHLYQALKKLG